MYWRLFGIALLCQVVMTACATIVALIYFYALVPKEERTKVKYVHLFIGCAFMLTSSMTVSSTYPYYKTDQNYTTQVYLYEASSYIFYAILKFLELRYKDEPEATLEASQE